MQWPKLIWDRQQGIKFPVACNLRRHNYYRRGTRLCYFLRLTNPVLPHFPPDLCQPLPQFKKLWKNHPWFCSLGSTQYCVCSGASHVLWGSDQVFETQDNSVFEGAGLYNAKQKESKNGLKCRCWGFTLLEDSVLCLGQLQAIWKKAELLSAILFPLIRKQVASCNDNNMNRSEIRRNQSSNRRV